MNMVFRSWKTTLLLAMLLFSSCGTGSGDGNTFAERVKYRQYFNNGRRLYLNNCSNCHQKDGTGLARLYPPIKNSDYFQKDPARTVCIVRNGQIGEIVVNGIAFNQPMPANPDLSNLEIAELTTYLYGMWSEGDSIFSPTQVVGLLKSCQ
jgi:mono/diheme cytochrome c family protein